MREFKLVQQPEDTPLCGAAVAAMILDKTLKEVLSEVDWRELCFPSGLIKYLVKNSVLVGVVFQTAFESINGAMVNLIESEFSPRNNPAIISAEYWEDNKHHRHWMLWTGKEILNPQPSPQQSYTIDGIMPIGFQEPLNYSLIHEKWKDFSPNLE